MTVNFQISSGYSVITIEMLCSDDGQPSYRISNLWNLEGDEFPRIRFSGRWVINECYHSMSEGESILWDSQSGKLARYPIKFNVYGIGKGVFEMFTVIQNGAMVKVHGEVLADRLDLCLSPLPVGTNGAPATFITVSESGTDSSITT
ncbi:hypothetical protein DL93DRAFT_2101509 [Clavulina sp. PMI_390]|nr:hypothetical protein DL93DRAFT_2101509 [Clavulina sp. PMI_390]